VAELFGTMDALFVAKVTASRHATVRNTSRYMLMLVLRSVAHLQPLIVHRVTNN